MGRCYRIPVVRKRFLHADYHGRTKASGMMTALSCKKCGQNYSISKLFGLCRDADPASRELRFCCPICGSVWTLTVDNEWIICGGLEELPDPVMVEHQRIYLPGIKVQCGPAGITVSVSGADHFIPYRPQGDR